MSIVLTKTFILLLYLQSIKNSLKEPVTLSIVKKMCTYRDDICKGQKTAVCTSRIVNNTLEYKFFSSTCYLFLSNICDQPGNEFTVISEDSCLNQSRRKSDRHTEEFTTIESERSIYKKHKNNVRDFESGDMVYENTDDDDDEKLAGRKYNDKEANDEDMNSDISNNKVTSMPKFTLLQDSSEPSEEKKRKEEREYTEPKEQRKVKKGKKDKTMKHAHHTRDKHLRKYTSKNKQHKITKHHHNHHRRHRYHHHPQRHKKSTSTKTKLRYKRHSVQKSESGSDKHINFRSYKNESLEDNKVKSKEFQSVNADDNDDKTPEEVSGSTDEDDGETKEEEIRNKSESKEDGKDTDAETVEIKQKTKDVEEENEGTNEVKKLEQSRESDLEKKLQNSDSYVRSHSSREIFSTSIEKTGKEISKESKSNDKSAQESYYSENQGENVSDNEKNGRRSLRHKTTLFHTHNKIKKKNRQSLQHRKSKIGNKKKHKNTIQKGQQNITLDKYYGKEDMEGIKDFGHLNKSRIILSENLQNKSKTIIFMVGDNITISDAASLYKLLTGNVTTNSQMSDKVDINGTAPNSMITDKVTLSVKNHDFTESFEKSTNSVDKVQMKANNNETNQIINHISSENDGIKNYKSGETDQGTENAIESGISTDKSVFDRSSENHTTSDHSTDRIDNYKDNNINIEIIENTDTTTTNTLLDYDDIEDLHIDRKFRLDVRDKLIELNLTDSNIDQYNETLTDIADFNYLIDAIHNVNKETIDETKLGVSEEKHSPIEVKTKPTRRIEDKKESNIERDIKLQEFIEDSIGRIENVQDKDSPSLRGNFRSDVWMDVPDLVDLAL